MNRLLPYGILAAGLLILGQSFAVAKSTTSVSELISRFAPDHVGGIQLEEIPDVDGHDAYEIESSKGKIILRGSSKVAQASAFYHYLKDFCHAHVSWNGDNLDLPAQLPPHTRKNSSRFPGKTPPSLQLLYSWLHYAILGERGVGA